MRSRRFVSLLAPALAAAAWTVADTPLEGRRSGLNSSRIASCDVDALFELA